MALTTKKVLNFSEIPEEVRKDHWIGRYSYETYAELHIDENDTDPDNVTIWITDNYPELITEDSFFIYMDI